LVEDWKWRKSICKSGELVFGQWTRCGGDITIGISQLFLDVRQSRIDLPIGFLFL
jgi:hypothetical protein